MGRYDDIIGLERPVSLKHPPMPRPDRAKQFMPFAALRGFDDEIETRGVIPTPRRQLSEDQREALDEQLRSLAQRLDAGAAVAVEVLLFEPEDGDRNGSYRRVGGALTRLNLSEGYLRIGRERCPLAMIDDIQIIPA